MYGCNYVILSFLITSEGVWDSVFQWFRLWLIFLLRRYLGLVRLLMHALTTQLTLVHGSKHIDKKHVLLTIEV